MQAYRIGIKLFVRDASSVELGRLVPVFHRWIQQQALSGHLLIDVGDYSHVPQSQRLVLVGHEANIALDDADGELGLLYQRKRPLGAEFPDRLAAAMNAVLQAAMMLENEGLKFKTDELLVRIPDQLHAPAGEATNLALGPALNDFFQRMYEAPVKLEYGTDPQRPFAVRIKGGSAVPLGDLLDRAAVAAF